MWYRRWKACRAYFNLGKGESISDENCVGLMKTFHKEEQQLSKKCCKILQLIWSQREKEFLMTPMTMNQSSLAFPSVNVDFEFVFSQIQLAQCQYLSPENVRVSQTSPPPLSSSSSQLLNVDICFYFGY